MYIYDVVIRCDNLDKHQKYIDLIMQALQHSCLYLNTKKCQFSITELYFLRDHISAHGIEPQSSKCDKIIRWPKPWLATNVRSFLSLVRYILGFLPKLADHIVILTPLTTKYAQKQFAVWTPEHDFTFESIKALVHSAECLTVIDHVNPDDNKI